MLSNSAMEDSYRQHVVQRILLQTMPNFSLLFGLREGDPWPSVDEANCRLASLKKHSGEYFYPFCEMLLADEYSYEIALQMHNIRTSLSRKESDSLSSLWKLKQLLRNTPTLLTLMPQSMLIALKSIQKPAKPDTWGLILLTNKHKIPCALCKKFIAAENSVRVRCQCCPFGVLTHHTCVDKKRCLVCSSLYHFTKIKAHQSL